MCTDLTQIWHAQHHCPQDLRQYSHNDTNVPRLSPMCVPNSQSVTTWRASNALQSMLGPPGAHALSQQAMCVTLPQWGTDTAVPTPSEAQCASPQRQSLPETTNVQRAALPSRNVRHCMHISDPWIPF